MTTGETISIIAIVSPVVIGMWWDIRSNVKALHDRVSMTEHIHLARHPEDLNLISERKNK